MWGLLPPVLAMISFFQAFSGVLKRVVFKKGGFGGCSPRTKTGTRVRSDVPPERKPEGGDIRMFPRNENQNEGTFAKNDPFTKKWGALPYDVSTFPTTHTSTRAEGLAEPLNPSTPKLRSQFRKSGKTLNLNNG